MGNSINNIIYQLQPKYLVTNFNFDAMAATVTQSNTSFKNVGLFRTKTDLVGMSWLVEDTLSHIDFRYPKKTDFSNVTLSYNYNISGFTPLMDANLAPTITVRTMDGAEYYVRLWNYVVNRPADSWEVNASAYLGENVYFPQGRTPGSATGASGRIVIDFDNLYAGWTPYVWQNPENTMTGEWVQSPDWVKVPVDNIKEIMWSFVPLNYNDGTGYQENSMPYSVEFSNWQVTGNCTIGAEASGYEVTQVRLCDDYDDIYNMTPERVVSEYERLGYREIVNFYIGASHYYDKYYYDGKMNVKTDYPFNQAFKAWYGDYLSRLHALGVNVIHSISMECVDPPESWKQRNWAGVAGTTNWDPKPSLLSFVNYDVKMFYMKYVVELARLSSERGMQPMIQLGESWWWYIEDGVDNTPCFYDSATLDEYKHKYGKDMHVFKTGRDSFIGHEDVLYFLRDKNGEFTHLLRDTVKAAYPNTLFTVLFFPPSVMDKARTPKMMSIVNLPVSYWAYPNLDFFMLEDYDYLIDGHMWKHYEAINFVQSNLAYPTSLIHYFAGFVLNSSKLAVWQNINQAIIDGFNQQFGQVYVWAYAQVKRDGWHPPVIVSASPKPGNYAEPQNVTLSVPAGCQLSYTTDGATVLTADASSSGSIYIDKNTTVHVTATKGDKQNVYDLTYTVPMREVGYGLNVVDGNPEEWTNDTILGVGSDYTHDMYGKMDLANVYIMVEGSKFDEVEELNLFLDMTGSTITGFCDFGWKNAGVDYKVTNNILYRYAGTGSDFIWEEVGSVPFARTYSCVEWAIPLSMINRTEPLPIYVGFSRNYEEYTPNLSNSLLTSERLKRSEYVTLQNMKDLGWKKLSVGYAYTYNEDISKTSVTKIMRPIEQSDVDRLNKWLEYYGITDPNVICHFLSQCMVECNCGEAFAEKVGDDETPPYLEDFIKAMPKDEEGKEKYPYKYRGAGAIHITKSYHYEDFYDEIVRLQGEPDENILCPSDDLEDIKTKGCNYVAFRYPWETATFYFNTKKDKNERFLIDICIESKEQDNMDYRQDLAIRPQIDSDITKNTDYNSTDLYESVKNLTIAVRGGDDKKGSDTVNSGGSFPQRKVYYRRCRDVLYPLSI